MKILFAAITVVCLTACGKPKPETLSFKIISTRPHDPECYTQGLEFHEGRLFESGGQYGQSTIREVDPLTGKVLRKRPMAPTVFSEGITVLNNELWNLTWKEKTAYVLEPGTFKFIRSHTYQGEGWGLTNDGKQLIMSDGSDTLKFIDPKDFSVRKTLAVRDGERPVDRLNELEYADGAIYANIYTTGMIARISPEDGAVTGWLDLSALRRQLSPMGKSEVLNGIARDPATGRFLVTGKYWPTMFEISVSGK